MCPSTIWNRGGSVVTNMGAPPGPSSRPARRLEPTGAFSTAVCSAGGRGPPLHSPEGRLGLKPAVLATIGSAGSVLDAVSSWTSCSGARPPRLPEGLAIGPPSARRCRPRCPLRRVSRIRGVPMWAARSLDSRMGMGQASIASSASNAGAPFGAPPFSRTPNRAFEHPRCARACPLPFCPL